MGDTIQLMWHPDLIKLFYLLKEGKDKERTTLLEGLNDGNLGESAVGQAIFTKIKNNEVISSYLNAFSKEDQNWVGGDEWHQKFRDYLELESVIAKPFEGYWDNTENCWYLSKGHYGDIGYYVMEYCLVPIENPQTINYFTLRKYK
jgi:hypothetical protein